MTSAELTTAQVADYLGVKTQTVYAYVSRGVLAPLRREAGVGSVFALADVQTVAGRGGRSGRRRATSDDVRTAITQVGAGSLAYRGHDVRDLVSRQGRGKGDRLAVGGGGGWTFEQVRDLLTGVPLPDRTGDLAGRSGPAAGSPHPDRTGDLAGGLAAGRSLHRDQTGDVAGGIRLCDLGADVFAVMAALPAGASVLDRFKHAVLVAAATDLGRHDRSPNAVAAAGARAAEAMVTALTDADPTLPMGRRLGAYLDLPIDLVDAILIVLADHDLAVSTTAVRVAISAGSDAYSALLAGLAAADSPLHVGASMRAVDWLRGAVLDPRAALAAALADGPPPGFGHVVYTEVDPRAQLLLERVLPGCDPGLRDTLGLLEGELTERRGWVVNVDLALAALVLDRGLPRDSGALLFACARTAGWTAHAIEELAEPGMRFRLRGVYTGHRVATM